MIKSNFFNNNQQRKSLWLNELDSFLRSQGAFPVVKLHGLLTAISSSPDMILPSQWMPLSKIQEIDFESTNQATEIMGDIMSLYNNINISLRKKTYKPILSLPAASNKDNLSYEEIWEAMLENAKLWAKGYWVGVEATWPFEGNMKFNPDIHSPLGIIYYLTLSKQEFIEECKLLKMTTEDSYQLIIDLLPSAAIEMYDFWLNSHEEYLNKVISPLTNDFKVGRNGFCPCGSGKKYKKCCLN